MYSNKIKYSYMYGFRPLEGPELKDLSNFNLIEEKYKIYTTINYIKLWYGNPPGNQSVKSLLGLNVIYVNHYNGERKEIKYQGAPLEGLNFETKELTVNNDDFISKMNLGFDGNGYITHLKFTTIKGEIIEFGEEGPNDLKSVEEMNLEKNIILEIRGYISPQGIRCLGVSYINYKYFVFSRLINIFRMKFLLNTVPEHKKKFNEPEVINKLDENKKCFLNVCKMPSATFVKVIKYL